MTERTSGSVSFSSCWKMGTACVFKIDLSLSSLNSSLTDSGNDVDYGLQVLGNGVPHAPAFFLLVSQLEVAFYLPLEVLAVVN